MANKNSKNNIQKVMLSLASADDIYEISKGEVTTPETINYKSYKPEKGGLFDETIFGPTTDYKCPICGQKYQRSNEGQICEKTDECKLVQPEILSKKSRRTRVGHIKLASPVVHFWFLKIDHSIISKMLGLSVEGSTKQIAKKHVEDVVYFKSHIVLESDGLKSLSQNEVIDINKAPIIYRNTLIELRGRFKEGSDEYTDISESIKELEDKATSKIGKDYGIDFYELNSVIEEYSNAKLGTGAKAIEYIFKNFDAKKEVLKIKRQIKKLNDELKKEEKPSKITLRDKLYKRLKVLTPFIKSGQDITSLLIYNLPVIPADLRPLIQIDGGRHSTSDINELYRRIIIRNNRLKRWQELDAPTLIVQNELRMLQESVDALIDNARKKSPVISKDNRPLKSIAEALSGKKGRLRQNLLGKRVDYSGRSVIVVGPNLKMHQAGIPRQMAAKLFEPWIVRELIIADLVTSIKQAKKMVEEQDIKIWPFVEKAIRGKVVLLNRAPSLHRLSVQAFEPVLVRGKAIMLHPLVTTAFNADFDGDQMAVHVPISPVAIREARELMLANKNILGPKDGEPIINPSQDMILGLFYLTKEKAMAKGEGNIYATYDEVIKAYEHGDISLHARIILPTSSFANNQINQHTRKYVITTVGKLIFNKSFPENFPYIFDNTEKTLEISFKGTIVPGNKDLRQLIKDTPINKPLTKKDVARIARKVFDNYTAAVSKEDVASVLRNINSSNYKDTLMNFAELKDEKGHTLSVIHSETLTKITAQEFKRINKRITLANQDVEPIFELKEKVELLESVWFHYTNVVANVLDNIKDLGFKYSMLSGVTVSIDDIKPSVKKKEIIKNGEDYTNELKQMMNKGLITDDERYSLVVKKWTIAKEKIQDDLKEITKEHKDNPIFMMMESGARGNISNFVQLAGMRGLMANNKKLLKAYAKQNIQVRNTIEVPVKSSFLDGLTAYEFYSSTHGARKGLTDTALNTAKSGYLTRRLIDIAQNIVVREDDCGSDNLFKVKDIIDTKTKTIIVPMFERIEGRYTAKAIKSGNKIIVPANTLITPEHVEKVIKSNIKFIEIRSVLGCQTKNGVCRKCFGKDLSTNKEVQIGEAVGIIAAQSIGEPGTQLTMRTFHTGGVAGGADLTGGFNRLMQLIDVTNKGWGAEAVISKTKGVVESVGPFIDADGNETNKTEIIVKSQTGKKYAYVFLTSKDGETRKLRIKKGDNVTPGKKLIEGIIPPKELLEVAGPRKVQSYIIKELQRLYRMTGISISDKYIEIIVRQMTSKIQIKDAGDSTFYIGSLVDVSDFKEQNTKLLLVGKKPAHGNVTVYGAKDIPLISPTSFLAAASYQKTAEVLVYSSLGAKQDHLEGLKENIIVGHKIPAGTGIKMMNKGKYDLKDPEEFFK